MSGRFFLSVFIFLAALAGARTQAQMPAALALEQSGASTPAIAPYSEILSGTSVSLQSGARLVFLHYKSCRQVAVVGGTVRFTENGYSLMGSRKESETRVQCPSLVVSQPAGETTGVVLRS